MRVSLKGGAYQARSLIADAQKCVNLYAEANPEGAAAPYTYYPTPGLTKLADSPAPGASRGVYRATTGDVCRVVGPNVYRVAADWAHTLMGTIPAGTTPVSMADNGLALVLVDGSAQGWAVDLATGTFGQITGDAFFGADRVDFVDTYLTFNRPGTAQWYISLSNATYAMLTGGTAFDPLDVAAKTGSADQVVSQVVMHRDVWLIGTLTTEVWFDAGAADFAFQRQEGVFVEHGCAAKYSVAAQDLAIYWLSQDRQGQGVVVRGAGYQCKRISTHAVEAAVGSYATISDAVGWTYQQGGHVFYVLTFPAADKTWVYDETAEQWHERAWADADGTPHRHRGLHAANASGTVVTADWQTGALYALDPSNFTDDGGPVVRTRSFPHLVEDGDRVFYAAFVADMEVGTITTPAAPLVSLRWSDDRGKTFGNPVTQGLGKTGEYLTSVQWNRLGMARDRVFELSWSAACQTALQGAWLDLKKAST